jgi:hypothetical protein
VSSPTSCPACAKALPAGATRCPNCGLVLDEHKRCPHCHAVAEVEPSEDARFVCAVCGGVRIPIDGPAVPRSSEQLELLKKATVARSARAIWSVVASIVGAFGVFSVLVLWLAIAVAHPPVAASIVAALAVLVPFGFSVLAWRRSRWHAAEFQPTFEQAWITAARDIARSRGGELDAAELAKLTRLAEKDADRLLARMSAESLLASSVTAQGNLKYTLVESPPADAEKRLPA